MRKLMAVLAFLIVAGVAEVRAQAGCPLTYEAFEFAVPHLDLDACPADLARGKAFCRASAGNDAVHVFAFSEEADRCLMATKSYPKDKFKLSID